MNLFHQYKENKQIDEKHNRNIWFSFAALLVLNTIIYYTMDIQLLDNRTVALFAGLGFCVYYFSKYRELRKLWQLVICIVFLVIFCVILGKALI